MQRYNFFLTYTKKIAPKNDFYDLHPGWDGSAWVLYQPIKVIVGGDDAGFTDVVCL